jgi:NADH dehydrogenase
MKTILVIGGGFAGVRVARDFLRHPIAGCEVLLVSEESYTTYNPMLP